MLGISNCCLEMSGYIQPPAHERVALTHQFTLSVNNTVRLPAEKRFGRLQEEAREYSRQPGGTFFNVTRHTSVSLGLLAYLRFEGGPGVGLGGSNHRT